MVALSEITPINDDFIEDPDEKSSLNRERIRRARFTFSSVVIPIGSTLYFSRNSNNTVKVVDDRRVEFEGQITSLSDATLTLLQRDYGWNANAVQGTNFWEFENETLRDRRLRLEEED